MAATEANFLFFSALQPADVVFAATVYDELQSIGLGCTSNLLPNSRFSHYLAHAISRLGVFGHGFTRGVLLAHANLVEIVIKSEKGLNLFGRGLLQIIQELRRLLGERR